MESVLEKRVTKEGRLIMEKYRNLKIEYIDDSSEYLINWITTTNDAPHAASQIAGVGPGAVVGSVADSVQALGASE